MDWYYGSGIDELVVSKDLDLSDRLPSPDSWSKWGINGEESFPSQFDCGVFDQEFSAEDGFDTKSAIGDAEMEDSVPDKYSSSGSIMCRDFSDETLFGERVCMDGQALSGSGRIDDIFVSSLREDLPELENLGESFFFSSKSHRDGNSEKRNAMSNVRSPGSLRYLKTQDFSRSFGLQKDCKLGSDFVWHNLEEESSLVKEPSNGESAPSEKNVLNRDAGNKTSLDAAILLDLKLMASQLTEKTRICFRDALYRLSKNSFQHRLFQNEDGDLIMEIPSTLNAETKRTATESETNVFDRAIANLMFNRMEFNIRDRPNGAASSNYESYPTQFPNSNDYQIGRDDDEVPFYLSPEENLSRSGNGSGNKSLMLEFGSLA